MLQTTPDLNEHRTRLLTMARALGPAARQWGARLVALCLSCGLVLAVIADRAANDSQAAAGVSQAPIITKARVRSAAAAAPLFAGYEAGRPDMGTPSLGAGVLPMWVPPMSPGGTISEAYVVPAMLTMPRGWREGDPAVVIVAEQPWAEPWRSELTDELLATGAAVLDLGVHSARGVSADSTAALPPPTPEDLLPDLFGALRLLRTDIVAGPFSSWDGAPAA